MSHQTFIPTIASPSVLTLCVAITKCRKEKIMTSGLFLFDYIVLSRPFDSSKVKVTCLIFSCFTY